MDFDLACKIISFEIFEIGKETLTRGSEFLSTQEK